MKASKCICSLGAALVLLGCSDGETPTPWLYKNPEPIGHCETPFLGDPNMNPEIELVSLAPGGILAPITEGGSVSLLQAPGAGRVLFVGARLRNMHPCAARIAGQLKDPVSEQVRIDNRIINFEPTNDGWGGSESTDIGSFSNLSVCPNQWSMQDLFGQEYELTMAVTDRDGRSVTQSVRVVPACDEPGNEAGCMCQCKQGYKLGEQCSSGSDGGP